mgnify:CR=1 FL=1
MKTFAEKVTFIPSDTRHLVVDPELHMISVSLGVGAGPVVNDAGADELATLSSALERQHARVQVAPPVQRRLVLPHLWRALQQALRRVDAAAHRVNQGHFR